MIEIMGFRCYDNFDGCFDMMMDIGLIDAWTNNIYN